MMNKKEKNSKGIKKKATTQHEYLKEIKHVKNRNFIANYCRRCNGDNYCSSPMYRGDPH